MKGTKILFAMGLTLSMLQPWPADAKDKPKQCPDGFAHERGYGCSRREPGGKRRIKLADGQEVTTHGVDGPAGPSVNGRDASSSSYVCVGSDVRHVQLRYIKPAGVESRHAAVAHDIRESFYWAANRVDQRSVELGGPNLAVPVLCQGHLPAVFYLESSYTLDTATFQSYVDELRAHGGRSSFSQYWSWIDGVPAYVTYGPGSGEATIDHDDRPGPDNANNLGPAYSFTYGGSGAGPTMLHEAGHNWGAVQRSAPNATAGIHCRDDHDVMCYDDDFDGPTTTYTACARDDDGSGVWDCNGDDYFNPTPTPGSYLERHWNVARCSSNQFLVCRTYPTAEAPEDLRVSRYVRTRAVLHWRRPGGVVTGYRIYACATRSLAGCTPDTPAGTVWGAHRTQHRQKAGALDAYCFAVVSVNGSGESGRSGRACASP